MSTEKLTPEERAETRRLAPVADVRAAFWAERAVAALDALEAAESRLQAAQKAWALMGDPEPAKWADLNAWIAWADRVKAARAALAAALDGTTKEDQ